METLTFGEQVKIILGRKGMTIKELAEIIEARTGKKMSRQNLTQRLGRDNFQEQDMRMIADILGCPFYLSILSVEPTVAVKPASPETTAAPTEQEWKKVELKRQQRAAEKTAQKTADNKEKDMTIGELYDIHEELSELEKSVQPSDEAESVPAKTRQEEKDQNEAFRSGGIFIRKKGNFSQEEKPVSQSNIVPKTQEAHGKDGEDFEPVITHEDGEEDLNQGEVNPYTGREYQSNSVRMHPGRIGYVQVYDRSIHRWTDMTEWAFLGYQERKKALLGKGYEPPIYLD